MEGRRGRRARDAFWTEKGPARMREPIRRRKKRIRHTESRANQSLPLADAVPRGFQCTENRNIANLRELRFLKTTLGHSAATRKRCEASSRIVRPPPLRSFSTLPTLPSLKAELEGRKEGRKEGRREEEKISVREGSRVNRASEWTRIALARARGALALSFSGADRASSLRN